jgi:hypothetical protein
MNASLVLISKDYEQSKWYSIQLSDAACFISRFYKCLCYILEFFIWWDIIQCRAMKSVDITEENNGSIFRVKGSACWLLHVGFFLGSHFDLDDGDTFLQNIGWFSVQYTTLYPRWQNSLQSSSWEPQIEQAADLLVYSVVLSNKNLWQL